MYDKRIKMKILNLIIAYITILFLFGCTSGSHIITGKVKPPISESEVKLYIKPPKKYEIIGIVEASTEVEISSQIAQDRTIRELKAQAAQIGANGILINTIDNKFNNSIGFYSNGLFYTNSNEIKTAKGQAIFVIKK